MKKEAEAGFNIPQSLIEKLSSEELEAHKLVLNTMKQTEMAKSKKYPIYHNGFYYNEKDCHDLFNAFYQNRKNLMPNNYIYMVGGAIVDPDGNQIHPD